MESTIVVAIISGVFTLTGVIITLIVNSRIHRNEMIKSFQEQNARINDELKKQQDAIKHNLELHETESRVRIETLSDRVEKHNNVIERTFKLEQDVRNLFHRYEELRDDK